MTPVNQPSIQSNVPAKPMKRSGRGGGKTVTIVPAGSTTDDADASSVITGTGSVVKEAGGLLAEVEVAREADFGVTDVTYTVMSHLGHILIAGKGDSKYLDHDANNIVEESAFRYNDTVYTVTGAAPNQHLFGSINST